jgi:glycosyltransferase involved in cell wall biosynthesis
VTLSFLFVVPTLNSYKLLPRLLLSLQTQTWTKWRLLFVDGPSSDTHRRWLKDCVASDSRCSWVIQDPSEPGIFGAMNQGFDFCFASDYLLFWGSDDWAPHCKMLEELASSIDKFWTKGALPDLVICVGRYVDSVSGALTRSARFKESCVLDVYSYRRALLLGSTPPHQATLFGHGARQFLSCYSSKFSLAADLDYFLKLGRYSDLHLLCIDREIVYMSDDGVSGQRPVRRLREVVLAYYCTFGWLLLLPLVSRYIRRLISVFYCRR